jgi:hypothetical protein
MDAAMTDTATLSSLPGGVARMLAVEILLADPGALKGLHGCIDAMTEADPAIATSTIWQRLADDQGVTVAYPSLRAYVISRRGPSQSPGVLRHGAT